MDLAERSCGGGRALASDNTEFLRIRLPVSLGGDECEDDANHHHDDGRGPGGRE